MSQLSAEKKEILDLLIKDPKHRERLRALKAGKSTTFHTEDDVFTIDSSEYDDYLFRYHPALDNHSLTHQDPAVSSDEDYCDGLSDKISTIGANYEYYEGNEIFGGSRMKKPSQEHNYRRIWKNFNRNSQYTLTTSDTEKLTNIHGGIPDAIRQKNEEHKDKMKKDREAQIMLPANRRSERFRTEKGFPSNNQELFMTGDAASLESYEAHAQKLLAANIRKEHSKLARAPRSETTSDIESVLPAHGFEALDTHPTPVMTRAASLSESFRSSMPEDENRRPVFTRAKSPVRAPQVSSEASLIRKNPYVHPPSTNPPALPSRRPVTHPLEALRPSAQRDFFSVEQITSEEAEKMIFLELRVMRKRAFQLVDLSFASGSRISPGLLQVPITIQGAISDITNDRAAKRSCPDPST